MKRHSRAPRPPVARCCAHRSWSVEEPVTTARSEPTDPGPHTERVTGIEPALSAWESVRLRPSTWPDLRVGVSASDRERPLVAGANCTLIARRSRGRGVPRAGAGKILPRPRRTVGGEKAGRPEPYKGGTGARAPAWTVLQALVALVLVVSPYRRECATLPWRFIRRAPRLVTDLRPERDSNAGPTA
jgi:hypothetical protein